MLRSDHHAELLPEAIDQVHTRAMTIVELSGKELVMTNKFGEIVDTHPGGDHLLEDASENSY